MPQKTKTAVLSSARMAAAFGFLLACGGRTLSPAMGDFDPDGGPIGGGAGGQSGNGSGGIGGTGTGGTALTGGTGGNGAVGGSGGAGAIGGSGGSGALGGSGGAGGVGASSGSGAVGGTGGTGGVPTCVPGQSVACTCASGVMGAQVCRSNGTFEECVCQPDGGTWEQQELARIRRGIIGRWAGVQTNPWQATHGGPCPCTVTFGPTIYSGHSEGEKCVVFYWGTNKDSSQKNYLIDDVRADGAGVGRMTLVFDIGTTTDAQIRDLVLSADESQLKFEVLYAGSGSLVFDLKRVP